jgi:hypothetical protein
MRWIDYRKPELKSELRDGEIVKARVVALRGGGWEATDLTGKLSRAGGGAVGNFRSLDEAKRAIEALWNYVEGELPGSD